MSDYISGGGEGAGTGTSAPTTSGGDGGQGGAMPASVQPAGGTSPGQLPAGAGNFDGENLLAISRGIFGEGHESEAQADLEAKQAQPESETPAQPQAQPAGPDWAALGEYDQVRGHVDLVTALTNNPKDFWTSLQTQNADHVIAVLDAAIENGYGDFLIDTLHNNGLLSIPSSAELASINEKYHDMYARLSPQERYEIQMMDDPDAQYDALESHLRDYERDRQVDEHEKRLNDYQAQERLERAHQLTADVRKTVIAGIEQQFRGDLQLTGDPQFNGKIGGILYREAERTVCSDPANRRQLELLDQAINRGNTAEAHRLAGFLQAKAGKFIRGFLDELNGALNGAQAPAPAPGRSAAQQGAARVDRILDKAMSEQPDSDLTEESKRTERIKKISRSIFR